MATDQNQMTQLLAMYRQMFPNGMPGSAQAQAYSKAQAPGQAALGLGNAPAGTNTTTGGVNALSKLLLAMMQKKRMQDYQAQFPQQGTTAMGGAQAPVSPPAGGTPGGVGGGTPPGL